MLSAESVRKITGGKLSAKKAKYNKGKYDHLSKEDRLKIVKEAISTKVKSVADKYNVSETTIYEWIKKSGLEFNKSTKTYTDIEKRVIVEHSYNHSLVKSSERFGVAKQTISNWRESYGV